MNNMKKDWTREYLEKNIVGKTKGVTIPVNISFDGKQKILDMSELEGILRSAKVIAQDECYCRKELGNCIEPMDGCLYIDENGIRAIEKGSARRISVEDALQAMERTYDAGLVHMVYTEEGESNVDQICSCCSCCCHVLSASIRFGYSPHVFSSKFITTHDSTKCKNCGICVERCQFNARELDDGNLVFHKEKCFGCGLCLRTCPQEAIAMRERGWCNL